MFNRPQKRQQRGASLVHFVLVIVPLLAMGAFAVDMGNVLMWQAALQRAVDAAALEGARMLYCADGRLNYADDECGAGIDSANNAARSIAEDNLPDAGSTLTISVDRGHWGFKKIASGEVNGVKRGGYFEENNSATSSSPLTDEYGKFRPVFGLPGEDVEELNTDDNDINAVRVTATRNNPSLFGLFANLGSYPGRATAVAYIGFAASVNRGEIDAPIALCLEKITDADGDYSCQVGRYFPSAEKNDDPETLYWTNLTQPIGNCPDQGDFRPIIAKMSACGGDGILNDGKLTVERIMQTSNKVQDTSVRELLDCWKNDPTVYSSGAVDTSVGPDLPWHLKVPVVRCDGYNPGECKPLIGAVGVRVLWIVDQASKMTTTGNVPSKMSGVEPFPDWDGTSIVDVVDRWDSFVQNFKIGKNNETSAECNSEAPNKCEGYRNNTIYFAPDCTQEPLGGTGGGNLGIRSVVPVLVF